MKTTTRLNADKFLPCARPGCPHNVKQPTHRTLCTLCLPDEKTRTVMPSQPQKLDEHLFPVLQ